MARQAETGEDLAPGIATSRKDDSREALERRVAELEAALKARDAFLRVATHELRGPLAAIQLQADTISLLANQGASTAEVDARAARVSGQVQRLARLLEEVLDLARASSGRLQILRGEVDLGALVQDELARAREDVRRSGCDVEIEIASGVTGPWDQARVEHAVAALLAAATRSGAGAPIAIAVSADESDGRVEVRWGGSGIADSQVALVHGEFEAAVTRAAPGANIMALWLAGQVARAHGGRLELEPNRAELRLPRTK